MSRRRLVLFVAAVLIVLLSWHAAFLPQALSTLLAGFQQLQPVTQIYNIGPGASQTDVHRHEISGVGIEEIFVVDHYVKPKTTTGKSPDYLCLLRFRYCHRLI